MDMASLDKSRENEHYGQDGSKWGRVKVLNVEKEINKELSKQDEDRVWFGNVMRK